VASPWETAPPRFHHGLQEVWSRTIHLRPSLLRWPAVPLVARAPSASALLWRRCSAHEASRLPASPRVITIFSECPWPARGLPLVKLAMDAVQRHVWHRLPMIAGLRVPAFRSGKWAASFAQKWLNGSAYNCPAAFGGRGRRCKRRSPDPRAGECSRKRLVSHAAPCYYMVNARKATEVFD
jgi:hypothetical protein